MGWDLSMGISLVHSRKWRIDSSYCSHALLLESFLSVLTRSVVRSIISEKRGRVALLRWTDSTLRTRISVCFLSEFDLESLPIHSQQLILWSAGMPRWHIDRHIWYIFTKSLALRVHQRRLPASPVPLWTRELSPTPRGRSSANYS
jgi:hypothetical protein